jgi:hypothetical protein
MQAQVEFALKHPEISGEFQAYLEERFCRSCKGEQ